MIGKLAREVSRVTFRQNLAGKNWRYRLCRGMLAALCIVAASGSPVRAAQVNGTLVAYEGSAPQGGRYLHFQNKVTRDCYMAETAADGSFGAQLPPGVYSLRAERGAILVRGFAVGSADIVLGQVNELAPYAPGRLWYLQAIAPSLLSSPAPSTANILTADATVLPPQGRVMTAPLPGLASAPADFTEPTLGPAHAVTPQY
jgi:hypothetical protein